MAHLLPHVTFQKYSTWWHLSVFQTVELYTLMHGHSFTHISIVRSIRNLLNINMGKDRGGLLLLDDTV